ncbi:MAG: hypothetical protein AAFR51_03145 [Pseudomonadota bacterium]
MSEAWHQALRFAALPGAAKVRLERQSLIEDETRTVRYRLTSFTADGETIGDDRDYDLLKAVMSPLEALADAAGHKDLKIELDLENGALSGFEQS